MIADLSPAVLGREVDARPLKPRRVPNPARATNPVAPKTVVARHTAHRALSQDQLATWPGSARPAGYYASGKRLEVPTY